MSLDQDNAPARRGSSRTMLYLASELIFNLVPILALSLVLLSQSRQYSVIYSADISLISAVMNGQLVVKLANAAISSRSLMNKGATGLLITLIIALGLIPSVIIYVIIITSSQISPFLSIAQIILLIVSSIAFLFIGTASLDLEKGDTSI